MGNASFEKGIKSSVLQEFENLLQNKQRNYLTVSEIVKFQHPEHYPFTFDHLGNLFVLNASRSGVFTVEELYKFAEFCEKNLRNIKTYEFQSQLQAATTQVLLQHLQTENGENEIVDWCESMLVRNEKNETTFERTGNTRFIRIQTVNILYEIFKVKLMNGMEIQSFFYLLQQCGEEAGLMAPDMKELDEYAPAEMGKEFARQYLRGFAKLMKEVGFNDGLNSTATESNSGGQFQVPPYNTQLLQQQSSQLYQEQQQYQRNSDLILQQQSNNQKKILQNFTYGDKQILPNSLSSHPGQQFQRTKMERLSHNSMDIENEEDDDEDDDDNDEYDYEDDEQQQQQQYQNNQNTILPQSSGQQQPFYQSESVLEQTQEQQSQAYQLNQNIINPSKSSNRNNNINDTDNYNNTMNRSSMNNSNNIQNEDKVVTIPALKMGSMMLKGGKKSQ